MLVITITIYYDTAQKNGEQKHNTMWLCGEEDMYYNGIIFI